MAFTYRNPLEIAINKLPSKQSDQLLALTTDEIEKSLGIVNDLFAFFIKPEEQELLQSKGLALAPIGFKSHSHPMCKMIENHVLYIVVPSLVKHLRSVAFFSLRDLKHNKFIKMFSAFGYGKIKSMGMYNAIIDAKDKLRYGDTNFDGLKDRVLGLRDDCLKLNKFPKVLFLHDELHFLTPLDVAFIFDTLPELDRIIATTIAPVELIEGDTISKEPRVYSFKVHGDTLSFYPDGVASECYEQSISNTCWPFKCSSIEWSNRSIRVTKLYSLFAHHVISFDRGRQRRSMIHFDKPSCLLNEELRVLTDRFDTAVINRSTVSSLSTYMACLKTANASSAVAKLRQLERRDLYPDELNFVYSFGEHFKNFGMRDDFDISVLQWVKDKFCQVMPNFISKTFFEKDAFHINMRKLLDDLATKGVEHELSPLQLDCFDCFPFSCFSRIFEVASSLGIKLNRVNQRNPFDTRSETYYSSNFKIIFPNVHGGYRAFNFRDKSLEICKYESLIKRRFYNLKFDFLKKLERREWVPLAQKKICWRDESLRKSKDKGVLVEPTPFITDLDANQQDPQGSTSMLERECTSELPETSDRANFEGSIPVDLINEFQKMSMPNIRVKKMKRKNDCVFVAIAQFLHIDANELIEEVINSDISEELFDSVEKDKGLSHEMIEEVLILKGVTMVCTENFENMYVLNRKYGPNGKMYCTISKNHCMLSSKDKFVKLLEAGSGPSISPECLNADSYFDFGIFKYDASYAVKLAKSLNRGTTGLLAEINPELCKDLVKIAERAVNFSGRVGLRFGFAGSGKTKAVLDWINYTGNIKRMFISPRRLLADQVQARLNGTHCEVHTFETALSRIDPTYKEVFIDEVGLLPPGYLTLLQLAAFRRCCNSFNEKIAREKLKELLEKPLDFKVLGDPLQMRYHSSEDTNLLGKEHEIDSLSKIKHKYLLQGYRFGSWFKEMLDIPTRVDDSKFSRKFFSDTSSLKREDYDAILVASQEEKKIFAGSIPVYTFSESQGLDKSKKVLICLSQHTFNGNANSAIVALTRSKVGFDFILRGFSLKEVHRYSRKTIWQFPIDGTKIPLERIVNMNPNASFYETPIDVGNSSIQDKASNDPFIMPFINLAEEEKEPEEASTDIIEAPEWFKTHIPVFDCDPMLAEIFERVELKEKREFQSILGYSNQFLDIEKGNCKIEILPFARQNVFPHHQASDDVTFWEGVKKRIRKSNWRKEQTKFEEVRDTGKGLLKEFLNMFPEEFRVNIKDIEDGEKSFIEKRKQKSEKLWENHSERSDIDWRLDHIFLFMKSQYCTKEGKMFTTAKAGQTLACFQHIVLFKFGPMLRAIESAFLRACGDSYYIHSGKNFFALDAFVKLNSEKFDGYSIESDYESFDSSQDHTILAFEMALLDFIGVSKEFSLDYLRLKLTLGCRLGSLAIMRFTGEFCTFLFNTFANMLFTKLKYKIDFRRDRILFAGDDMCSLGSLKRRRSKKAEDLLKKFSLKAVEEVRKFPMFCGWYLSPYGILKSPRLLWARIKMMQERQLLKECVDNYLFEAIFAYRLGEKLYEILKEDDFEYHYLVIRFFVKNSKLLTGLSKSLILEIGEGIGNKWLLSTSTVSSQEQSHPILRSMPSNLMSYTKTQRSLIHQCLIALDDLRPTSRSPPLMEKILNLLTSDYLTETSWNSSQNRPRNSSTFMLELYLLQLGQCTPIFRALVVPLLSMMGHASIKINRRVSLLQMISPLKRTPVILLSDHSTFFQPQTYTSVTCCVLQSIWNVHNTLQRESSLLLMSELLTDCATHPDFLTPNLAQMVGPISQYQVVQHLILARRPTKFCVNQGGSFKSKMKVAAYMRRRDFSVQMNCVEVDPCLQKERTIVIGEELGPSQLGSKDSVKVKMSLEDVLQRARRHRVEVYLWKTYIDPNKQIIREHPHDSPSDPKVADHDLYELCVNHYCKFLFGNVAVFGSSDKTTFPAVGFDTPPLHYEVKGVGDNAVPAAQTGSGGTPATAPPRSRSPASRATKIWRIELHSICPELKSFCTNSRHNSLNECTFRKICEPFADLAREFLHERWSTGLTTNIYKKWPRALEKAPWVAFDFASGLKMNKLTPDEKQVIDRMTKRLFRTEGQKGIYEAGAESSLELEG